MNTEEKAKAYDEALEKAKVHINSKGIGDTVDLCKHLFPGLAESEDEDEKIRKELIDQVQYIIPEEGEYDEEGLILPQYHERINQYRAYLKKQKELPFVKDVVLGYPGHYFYDGERMHFCSSPAMEEKQKESLRDFVDDFPYSDEQKEQNEESSKPELKTPEWVFKGWDDEYMINTVIGRYSLHAEVAKKHGDTHDYNLSKSMENWLRNVVKPLILEKQKPISAEEVLTRAGLKPYKDGNQWCILAGDNIQEGICGFGDTIDEALYQFLMEVLEMQKDNIAAEKFQLKLKKAKENKYVRAQVLWELMHNGIITEVDYQYLTDDKRKPWTAEEYRIAYQKGFEMSEQLKQKEQKSSLCDNCEKKPTCLDTKYGDDRAVEQCINFVEKEQKPMNLLDTMLSKDPHLPKQAIKYEQKPADYCSVRDEFDLDGNLKQKPAELTPLGTLLSNYLKNDIEYFATKKWDDKKWNEVMNIQASELLRIAKNELGKEKNPTEWSDDDEQYLLVCKNALQKYQHSGQWDANIISDWLEKHLKFSYQPKNEWSEEDELMRTAVIQTLERFGGRGTTGMQIDWLKSLPLDLKKKNEDVAKLCSNEWNKEDEEMLVRLLDSISIGNDYEEMRDWLLPKLKSLLFRTHWKPSEEQMGALKDVAYGTYQSGDGPALRELYEQLKKQM